MNLPQAVNKGKRRIAKLKSSVPLLLTEGKGKDEQGEEVEDEEEYLKQERKGDYHQAT